MKVSGLNRKGYVFILFCALNFLFFLGSAFASSGDSGASITVMPDGSLVIQIVNFIFLIWILNVVLYKPVRKILGQRKEKVSVLEDGIESFNREAKEKGDAFSGGIKEARMKGLKEKEILLNEAADEERNMIEKINKKAQADLSGVRKRVASDVMDVRASLLKEIDEIANLIGQKILGRAI